MHRTARPVKASSRARARALSALVAEHTKPGAGSHAAQLRFAGEGGGVERAESGVEGIR